MTKSSRRTLLKLEREIKEMKRRLPLTNEEVRSQKRNSCLRGDHVWGEISGDPFDPIQNCINCGKPRRINLTDKEWFKRQNNY